jgi:putative ABC transport system permease protein
MFTNYFKTAIRNLLKNKTFGLLNIVGLGVGVACAALILVMGRR